MTVNDKEFYESSYRVPFSLSELKGIISLLRDMVMGLVELAFPETRAKALLSPQEGNVGGSDSTVTLTLLFKSILSLLKELHIRDTRKHFCPDDHWHSSSKILYTLDRTEDIFNDLRLGQKYLPFQCDQTISKDEMDVCGPPMSTKEIRTCKKFNSFLVQCII